MIAMIRERLRIEPRRLLVYVVVYGVAGTIMNEIGKAAEIARFTWWWQIITVYILSLIPVSVFVRRMPAFDQYLYGLFFLALLEFGGYALETSYAYPGNIVDQFFNERNFALFMALAFGTIPPIGNLIVGRLSGMLFGAEEG